MKKIFLTVFVVFLINILNAQTNPIPIDKFIIQLNITAEYKIFKNTIMFTIKKAEIEEQFTTILVMIYNYNKYFPDNKYDLAIKIDNTKVFTNKNSDSTSEIRNLLDIIEEDSTIKRYSSETIENSMLQSKQIQLDNMNKMIDDILKDYKK